MASTLKIDTVTTPDGTGNITFSRPIVADGSNLTNLPASGKILQVVSATKTDTASNSNTSFTDITGLSVSITPSATSSKVLVFFSVTVNGNNAGSSLRIARDSTAICVGDAAGSRIQSTVSTNVSSGDSTRSHSGNFLDSPSTTSATTYKMQWRSNGNTDYLNRSNTDLSTTDYSRTASTITVMEIGA